MISWLKKRQKLDLLEEKLLEVSARKRDFAKTKQQAMKKRVLGRIEGAMAREEIGFEQLAEQLEKLTLKVEPSKTFTVHSRQSVIDSLTFRDQRIWMQDLVRDLLASRRMWATVTACFVLVAATMGYVMQMPQVEAAKVSAVDSYRGTVVVERGEDVLSLAAGMLIQEGDTVITEGDGWVDLVFVDDSLVTLGPETSVAVSKLWVDPQNEANTSVSLAVEEGRIWSKVMNLSPDHSLFTVMAGDSTFSVDRKAAFDVVVNETSTEFRVFSQLVDFHVVEGDTVRDGTLGESLAMQLHDGDMTIFKMEPVDELKNQDVWVQTNLDNNEKYVNRLQAFYEERATQKAGVLPGEALYFLERSGEKVRLMLTFGDEAWSDLHRVMAENRFSEATVLLAQGNDVAAEKALDDYQETLVNLAERGVGHENRARAVLDESKKMVDGVGFAGSFQNVRDVVEETSSLVVNDAAEREVIQLETAADRLGLAMELLDIGAYDLAFQALSDYQVGLNEVIEGLPSLEFEARKQVVLQILDQKLHDLQMIKLISAKLDALVNGERAASAEVQAQVEEVYADTLLQLNTLVLSLKERAVMQLSVFLEDVKYDEDIQRQVLSRLKKSVDLEFEFMTLINDLEAFYADESLEVMVVEEETSLPSGEVLPIENYLDDQVENTGAPQDLEAGSTA